MIEVLVAAALLTVASGLLLQTWVGISDTSQIQSAKAAATDQALNAVVTSTRELRQAARSTISPLPASTLEYRVATDLDGNGLAVDPHGRLEMSALRRIVRDYDDANGDGVGETQLVLIAEGAVHVLASGLAQDEDRNNNGALDEGEDANRNGALDHGVWFETEGRGIRVTVRTQGTSRRVPVVPAGFTQLVVPRN